MRRSPRRSVLSALVVALALVVAGCSESNDPETWEDAEAQDGFPVRTNFLDACTEANAGEQGLSEDEAPAFCECAFTELREQLTFEEFDALDDDLRADNETVPTTLQTVVDGCLEQVG